MARDSGVTRLSLYELNESYKRGCQERILLLPLREETDGGLHPAQPQFWRGCGLAAYSGQTRQFGCSCIRPNLSSGEAAGSPRIPDRPGSLAVRTRRFHDARVIRRLRFWKLRKQTRWL